MSNEINIEKLREEVNPVYSTAQSCMQIVAKLGDAESEELRKKLGFTQFGEDSKSRAANIPQEVLIALGKIQPALMACVESRFFSSNNFIKETGTKQVLDLPCGYTARGMKLAKSGVRYYGTDLPAVIDVMAPAVKDMIADENISYTAVDATNYASLRKALEGAEGELHITTEGLLMYFTQPELETVFGNIRKLLLEFGGRWVTLDNELNRATNNLVGAVISDMPKEEAMKIANIAAGTVSKTTLTNNVYFDDDIEKAKKFVSDMGFDLELVPMSKYLPESLVSFSGLSDENRKKAMEVLASINYWVMTAKPGTVDEFVCTEDNFKADVKLTNDTLNISLTGRLDTISAPGLLAAYREAEAKGGITSVCIDMKQLEYISSAGLRVLLIMRKAVKDEKSFSLININDTVQEIIETTGFDTIFC